MSIQYVWNTRTQRYEYQPPLWEQIANALRDIGRALIQVGWALVTIGAIIYRVFAQ